LETNGGAYQSGEQLEEDGSVPTKELAKDNMSEDMEAEQHLSEETTELEYIEEW
jgi:hypothetical protein